MKIIATIAILATIFIAGCGGSGNANDPEATTAVSVPFTLSADEYERFYGSCRELEFNATNPEYFINAMIMDYFEAHPKLTKEHQSAIISACGDGVLFADAG